MGSGILPLLSWFIFKIFLRYSKTQGVIRGYLKGSVIGLRVFYVVICFWLHIRNHFSWCFPLWGGADKCLSVVLCAKCKTVKIIQSKEAACVFIKSGAVYKGPPILQFVWEIFLLKKVFLVK